MTHQIFYTKCPSCYSTSIIKHLTAIDYTVSGESFEIWHCNDCTLRFTQDIPDENAISRYYKSENYISHTDTSKGIINQLYRAVRRFTL